TLPTTTYELEIVAKDMAGSEVGLTGTATATITITDKNDHAPEFTHTLTLAVMGVAPGSGQQGPVSAGLSRGMANGCHGLVRALHDCFTTTEIHGVLTLSGIGALSAAGQEPSGHITQNTAVPPTAWLPHRIKPNLTACVWFEAYVYEGSTGVVVNLTVDDRDDPDTGAGRAIYSIINGDPTLSFEIQTNPDNNEGMLSVIKPLDYEAERFHALLIKVENEDPLVPDVGYGPSSTATVRVTVLDINEGPVFFPDPLTVNKMENIPLGSFVASLNATDPDILQAQSVSVGRRGKKEDDSKTYQKSTREDGML
ncbi:Cadherin-13, partial [Dissostichus eleginoides]